MDEIPPEVLHEILTYLSKNDLRNTRLVNKRCSECAVVLLFSSISFDLSDSSIQRLRQISLDKQLPLNVRILERRGIPRLRKTRDFHEWRQIVSLPADRRLRTDAANALIRYEKWEDVPMSQQKTIFDDYEQDRAAMRSKDRCLQSHLSEDHGGLESALRSFVNISEFIDSPTVLSDERWVTQWRGLQINPYYFGEEVSFDEACNENNDIEALHTAYVLLMLGRANPSLESLKSMSLHVEGPAFWGPTRLQRLWSGDGHGMIRAVRERSHDAGTIDRELGQSFENDNRIDLQRLDTMKTAFETLTQLEISVAEDRCVDGLSAASRSLFDFLCRASNLQNLRLVVGRQAHGVVLPSTVAREDNPGESALLTLLADQAPWKRIKDLALEIVTETPALLKFLGTLAASLRQLHLTRITLLQPDDDTDVAEASWEEALPKIVQMLPKLERLDLEKLYDFNGKHCLARDLFDETAEEWKGRLCCYAHYRETMLSDLLGSKTLQHSLDPISFLEENYRARNHEGCVGYNTSGDTTEDEEE
jgi:hypothetical protein